MLVIQHSISRPLVPIPWDIRREYAPKLHLANLSCDSPGDHKLEILLTYHWMASVLHLYVSERMCVSLNCVI